MEDLKCHVLTLRSRDDYVLLKPNIETRWAPKPNAAPNKMPTYLSTGARPNLCEPVEIVIVISAWTCSFDGVGGANRSSASVCETVSDSSSKCVQALFLTLLFAMTPPLHCRSCRRSLHGNYPPILYKRIKWCSSEVILDSISGLGLILKTEFFWSPQLARETCVGK